MAEASNNSKRHSELDNSHWKDVSEIDDDEPINWQLQMEEIKNIGSNWTHESQGVYSSYVDDQHRGVAEAPQYVPDVSDATNAMTNKAGVTSKESDHNIEFAAILKQWDNALRSLWFSTNLKCDAVKSDAKLKSDGLKNDAGMCTLIGLTLQFFSNTVPKTQNMPTSKASLGPSARFDVMNLNTDTWGLFGYYIDGKSYTEFSLDYFLTKQNNIGVNFRNHSGDPFCTNKLVDGFYSFLASNKGYPYVDDVSESDSEFFSESQTSEGPENVERGLDLAKSPRKVEQWLDIIHRRKGKRQTLLKLAHNLRRSERNASFLRERNAENDVSRKISALLSDPKARPSTYRAAVMALEVLHQNDRITDKETLQNIVQCFFHLLPEYGVEHAINLKEDIKKLGTDALKLAKDFNDDHCQNLKEDLLKLIENSDVPEGIENLKLGNGPEEDHLMDKIKAGIDQIESNENPDQQPSYMRKPAYQTLIDAFLPSDIRKWDKDQFSLYTCAHFGSMVQDEVEELCAKAKSCLEALENGDPSILKELQEQIKTKMSELKRKLSTPAEVDEVISWEDLKEETHYIVRKKDVPPNVEPWLAGMQLTLESKDEANQTAEMRHRNGDTTTLPLASLALPTHQHPKPLQISVLTSNPTMVDHAFLARQDMSAFLNSMQSGMQEVVESSKYEINYFHGALTSENLTNERVHILQIQGLCPQSDEERELGLILEDEADMGVVADLDDLAHRNFKLYSCKLLVLAQTYSRPLLSELHQNQKIPHILALSLNQALDEHVVDFLKVFYSSLQLECLSIQAAYDKAMATCNGKPFILYPEKSGHHDKRLIDLIYNGVAEKPGEKPFTLSHTCIPNNVPGRPAAMFGDKVPKQMTGPIANDFVHRICHHATSYPLTFAECIDSPVKTLDGAHVLFEYDIENLADNLIYRVFRSHWNENDVSSEHKYVNGIVHVKVPKGASGGDILRICYSNVRDVCGWENNYEEPTKIQKKLVRKIKKKKMCFVFEISDLGDEVALFFETIAKLSQSKTIRMIFLIQSSDTMAQFQKALNENDANIQFDLEDEHYLEEMLNNKVNSSD